MNKRHSDKKRHLGNNRGQGLVEYTLMVTLAVFVFWVAIKDVKLDQALIDLWDTVSGTVSGGNSPGGIPDGGGGGGSGGGGKNADQGASNSDAYSFPAQPETVPEGENSATGAPSAGGKNSAAQEDAASSVTADGKGSYMNVGPAQDISPLSVGWFMVFSVLLFVPYLLWAIVKAVRKSEGSSDSEVSYQNLEADQIVAKIKD